MPKETPPTITCNRVRTVTVRSECWSQTYIVVHSVTYRSERWSQTYIVVHSVTFRFERWIQTCIVAHSVTFQFERWIQTDLVTHSVTFRSERWIQTYIASEHSTTQPPDGKLVRPYLWEAGYSAQRQAFYHSVNGMCVSVSVKSISSNSVRT